MIGDINNNFTLVNQTKKVPYEKICKTATVLDGLDRISQYLLKDY